jgi:quercetin dioxygenase-like cupin family protein
MRKLLLLASLLCCFGPARADDGKVITPLMQKELTDLPGKEAVMITVDFAPGAEDAVHRHDAHAFVYVLEGSLVMQLKGAPAVTLKPGQVFYEGPRDVHLVGKNASDTRPAKILVVLVKNRGADVVLPAN